MGDCLFSSVSLCLVGNNDLVVILRLLSSLELYLNSCYYSDHPIFANLVTEKVFSSISNALCFSLSKSSVDSGLRGEDLVKIEAVNMASNVCKWSSFVSVLAVSSVIKHKIITYYPDFGLIRYRKLFNQEVYPRESFNSTLTIHILFCYLGLPTPTPFQPNHFAPLCFDLIYNEPPRKKMNSSIFPKTATGPIFKYFKSKELCQLIAPLPNNMNENIPPSLVATSFSSVSAASSKQPYFLLSIL